MLVRILGPLPQSFGHPAQAVPALGCPHCYTGFSCQPRVPARCLLAHRMQGLNVLRSRRQGQKRLKPLFCKLWNELVKLIQWLFNFFKSRALKNKNQKIKTKTPQLVSQTESQHVHTVGEAEPPRWEGGGPPLGLPSLFLS